MTKAQKQTLTVVLLTVAVVAADQGIKIAVKTGMYLSQRIRVTDWFYLLFTENNGMAFGMEVMNKYFLTGLRICLVPIIIVYVRRAILRGSSWGLLVCMALVLAGALGNIIDCVFYGLIFNNPPPPFVAEFVPFGHGYNPVFLGRVVDMFYFPLVQWNWPSWLPVIGGGHFVFFSPIFNFADASISCGIIALLLFYRHKILR
ncbi:MAG: lipoprotein signal peptidase [Prevotellaceae bacterium]|nr:lipoprotein signal peptidase [Prevotellaceae bacterium]